jgi:hypothetical protein
MKKLLSTCAVACLGLAACDPAGNLDMNRIMLACVVANTGLLMGANHDVAPETRAALEADVDLACNALSAAAQQQAAARAAAQVQTTEAVVADAP